MKEGFLLVLSGPSGVGKGSVCERLLAEDDRLKYSVSATTRERRPHEKEGKNYFFRTVKEFHEMIDRGELLEYALVHGNYYGTPRQFVLECIDAGNVVILEIDVQGALQVKKSFPGAVFVFLLPPSMEELEKRIIGRETESEESLRLRMKNARTEMSFVEEYEYAVINDELEKAVASVAAIVQAESLKVSRRNKKI